MQIARDRRQMLLSEEAARAQRLDDQSSTGTVQNTTDGSPNGQTRWFRWGRSSSLRRPFIELARMRPSRQHGRLSDTMTQPLARSEARSETAVRENVDSHSSLRSRLTSSTQQPLPAGEVGGTGPLNITTLAQLHEGDLPGAGEQVSLRRIGLHRSDRPAMPPEHTSHPSSLELSMREVAASEVSSQPSPPQSRASHSRHPSNPPEQPPEPSPQRAWASNSREPSMAPALFGAAPAHLAATLPGNGATQCMSGSWEDDSNPPLPLPVRRASSAPGIERSQSSKAASARLPVHLSQLRRGPSNCSLSRAGSGRSLTRGGSGRSLTGRIQEVEETMELTGSHPEVDEDDLC